MTDNMQTADEWRKQLLEQQEKLKNRMSRVKHKIAVISGKGDVDH